MTGAERLPLPQREQAYAAIRGRLLAQMHSLDPTIAASVEMSSAKAGERYFRVLEDVFTECVTLFDPDELIRRACDKLGFDGT